MDFKMNKFKYIILILVLVAQSVHGKFIERDDSWIPRLSKSDLDNYSLVSRIPVTSLFKFTFYRDISILYYYVPEDVIEAQFTFKAHEDKISILGGTCDPQDIDIHLKAGGYPVVSPQNISFPEDFVSNDLRNKIISLKMESDLSNNTIVIPSPVPGEWFGLAFVSWTDPKTDKIEQQGIATVCDTVLYTDLRVQKANVTIIASADDVKFTLRNSSNIVDDIYKIYINEEINQYSLNFSVISQCETCKKIIIAIQSQSIPVKDNNLATCTIDLDQTTIRNFVVRFESFPQEWHYVKVSYDPDNKFDGTNEYITCEEITLLNSVDGTKESVYELVRDSKSEYFTFEYNLPPYSDDYSPALINMTSDNVTSLKFKVFPVLDIGGTLTMGITLKLDWKYYAGYSRKKQNNGTEYHFSENDQFFEVVVCLSRYKRHRPLVNGRCEFNGRDFPATVIVNSTDSSSVSNIIHVPYPEIGTWYVTLALFCDSQRVCPCPIVTKKNETKYIVRADGMKQQTEGLQLRIGSKQCNASVVFSVSSASCLGGKCGPNGNCNFYMSGGFIYSTCKCRQGYAGWDCSDSSYVTSQGEVLMATLFLTLSNLLFIPSIYFAIRRKYYTEAIVYFFTMFFSTFYHACDTSDTYYSLCIVRLGVLQYCDFFCGLLSFWVTLIAMAALDNRTISILHMFGAIIIAFGTELNKQALLVFLIPVIIGVCIVGIAWGIRCKRTKKLFPARAYLVVYAPMGLLLAAIGLICFAFLQTNANYHIVHSIWHMVIALSILCFLPNREIFFPKS